VARLRRRLLLQPSDRGIDARLWICCRSRRCCVARHAANRSSTHGRARDALILFDYTRFHHSARTSRLEVAG
jgi:hypothetical protein